ncbi:MAG: helix-turn-helix domain-containing protein [Actinomycetota bacterium]
MSEEQEVANQDGRSGGVEPRLFTLEEVATYLNVSVPQVYALVRSQELPAVKIGGRGVWRVDRTQLDDYIKRLHDATREWAKEHPLNPR